MAGGLSFAVGKKLTPFQKHKKEEEEKKKRADAEAAKLYEEFAASFGSEEPEAAGSRSFVRGGTIQPGSRPSAVPAAAAAASSRYVPKFMPPGMVAALAGGPVVKQEDEQPRVPAAAVPRSAGSDRKPRKIDMMLQTLKREQEERTYRQQELRDLGLPANADDMDPGALSEVDPYTTNLYVGNLSPDVDEALLKKEFGRFGPIASVKIMWPRDDDQRRRGRNSGFVAFMTRSHAQAARDELNNAVLHDNELKVGWGKSVPIPAAPIYTSPSFAGASSVPAQRGAAVPPPGVEAPPPWTDPHAQEGRSEDVHGGCGPDLRITEPADERQRYIIDMLASYVLKDGCDLEQIIMEREASNPEFGFLYNLASPEHAYYRWRLFSLAQGDTLRTWREEGFVLLARGPRWLPPAMPSATVSQQTAAQRGGEGKDKDRPLSELQRDRFEDLLRGLTAERKDVRDAMVFALDNAESASEVVEILTEALTLPETPIPTKVARLFLASDILHNSTAPVRNASRYRNRLEETIPDVFQSFQETYRSAESRMQQEALRRHVLRVLRIWRDWFIFSDDFLNGLQATFLGGGSAAPTENSVLHTELEVLDDEALELRCRRSGLSRKGGRTAQTARLQALHAYLSGDRESVPVHHERTVSGITDLSIPPESSAQPSAWVLGGVPAGKVPSSGTDSAQGQARPVLSKWESADLPDPSPPAEVPTPQAVAVPASKPKAPEPISRWTEVDDADEDMEEPIAERIAAGAVIDSPTHRSGSEDIFGGSAREPDVSASAAMPESEAGSVPARGNGGAAPAAELDLDAIVKGTRAPKDDEERRQRLRQVEVTVMVFREDLEAGTLSKAAIDSEVAKYRAKLIAEAETEAASAAVQAAAEKKASLARPSRDGSRSERDREKARGGSERERDAEHRGSGKESSHSGRRSRDERNDRNDQQRDPEVTPRRRGDSPDDSRRHESRTDRDDRQRSKGDEPRRRDDSPEPSKRRESRSDRGGDERQRERRKEDDRERDGGRDRKVTRNRSGSPYRQSSRSPDRAMGKRSEVKRSRSRSPSRRDRRDTKRR